MVGDGESPRDRRRHGAPRAEDRHPRSLRYADAPTHQARRPARLLPRQLSGRLVRAALTILVGFCGGRRPGRRGLRRRARRELCELRRGRVVRQAVIWAGSPDPCRAITTADEQAAPEAQRLAHLTQHWFTAFGPSPIQVSEAARRLSRRASKGSEVELARRSRARVDHARRAGRFLKSNARGVALCGDGVRRIMTGATRTPGGVRGASARRDGARRGAREIDSTRRRRRIDRLRVPRRRRRRSPSNASRVWHAHGGARRSVGPSPTFPTFETAHARAVGRPA